MQEIEQLEQQIRKYSRNLIIIILLDLLALGILGLVKYFYSIKLEIGIGQVLLDVNIPIIMRGLIIMIGLYIFLSSILFYFIMYKRRKVREELGKTKG